MSLSRWVFSLKGVVQNYSWGGQDFLPSLLGSENREHIPSAEYWMGAHPNHSSIVIESGKPLIEEINLNREAWLGKNVMNEFGSLPFLLKVLDVDQMLSIQVHPDISSAKKGYDDETSKGIPVNAQHRNYKDRNHKPELMAALGDFWLLHGFKKEDQLQSILEQTPELFFLRSAFGKGNYKRLYEEVMHMDQDKVNIILQPLTDRILPLYKNGELQKDREDFWAARAALNFCTGGQLDRGIFSIYLFNLLHLKKGEGIYQQAGLPHAYLEGQNVEIMANSDNVLRAGLTSKHIDVPELMKHVIFEPTIPHIIRASGTDHTIYPSPAREFELHRYDLEAGKEQSINALSPEIILVLEGNMEIRGNEILNAKRGDAFFILPGGTVKIRTGSSSILFRALVPMVEN